MGEVDRPTGGGPEPGWQPEGGRQPEATGAGEGGPDVARRDFFRQFLSEAVQAAASVVGAANALQRSSSEAAGQLLGLVEAPPAPPAAPIAAPEEPAAPPIATFRSPFRFEGDHLVLLDQRRLPNELAEVDSRTAAETAAAIRDGIVVGSAAIAQVAAYGLALTADRSRTSQPFARRAILHGSLRALRDAAPMEMQLRRAVDRLEAAWEEVGDLAEDGDLVADRLRAEADALTLEMPALHARLSAAGAAAMPGATGQPLHVVTIGSTGPLACGGVGSALGICRELARGERSLEVYVGETRPGLSGARLAAWDLAQAGVPHTVVADNALGWLLATGRADVALVGAARIAANGDVAAIAGTYPLAALAARHGIPLYVCVPVGTIDPETPTGAGFDQEYRPPADLTRLGGSAVAPPGTAALVPAFDVTPAALVAAFVTEAGLIEPPFGPSLAAALRTAGLDSRGAPEGAVAGPVGPDESAAPTGGPA